MGKYKGNERVPDSIMDFKRFFCRGKKKKKKMGVVDITN